jgi:hypothetical protein
MFDTTNQEEEPMHDTDVRVKELADAIEKVSWILDQWYEAHEGEEDNDDLQNVENLFTLLAGIVTSDEPDEAGECDRCGMPYYLADRENRCGDCGDCGDCCQHLEDCEICSGERCVRITHVSKGWITWTCDNCGTDTVEPNDGNEE